MLGVGRHIGKEGVSLGAILRCVICAAVSQYIEMCSEQLVVMSVVVRPMLHHVVPLVQLAVVRMPCRPTVGGGLSPPADGGEEREPRMHGDTSMARCDDANAKQSPGW
jgi:hypothetical protein